MPSMSAAVRRRTSCCSSPSYLSLGEAEPASLARTACAGGRRQPRPAHRCAARGSPDTQHARRTRSNVRACYAEMRELLVQRGKFDVLEKLLRNEEFVGQALDHLRDQGRARGGHGRTRGPRLRPRLPAGWHRTFAARSQGRRSLAAGLGCCSKSRASIRNSPRTIWRRSRSCWR